MGNQVQPRPRALDSVPGNRSCRTSRAEQLQWNPRPSPGHAAARQHVPLTYPAAMPDSSKGAIAGWNAIRAGRLVNAGRRLWAVTSYQPRTRVASEIYSWSDSDVLRFAGTIAEGNHVSFAFPEVRVVEVKRFGSKDVSHSGRHIVVPFDLHLEAAALRTVFRLDLDGDNSVSASDNEITLVVAQSLCLRE